MITGLTLKDFSKDYEKSKCKYTSILEEFYIYSTDFKHISRSSALSEYNHIRNYLEYLNCDIKDLSQITAKELSTYIRIAYKNLKPSSIGRYITSLRNFFRFLKYKGISVNESIFNLPLTVANWGNSTVPIILNPEEEILIRNHYNLNIESHKRNNLIIRLMLDFGLRCKEISELLLSDIQWHRGTISIKITKEMSERELPFSKEFGMLLEEYILKYRPITSNIHLFLRKTVNNQYITMSVESVRYVVRNAFKKENITGWWKGTHALRRTAASRIYNSGIGLKLTADILGHKSLDSTKHYVKVDFSALRKITSPWPGGESNA